MERIVYKSQVGILRQKRRSNSAAQRYPGKGRRTKPSCSKSVPAGPNSSSHWPTISLEHQHSWLWRSLECRDDISIDTSSQSVLQPRKCLKRMEWGGPGSKANRVDGAGMRKEWDRFQAHPSSSPSQPSPGPASSPPAATMAWPWKCASLLSLDTNLSLTSSDTGWNFPTKTVLKPNEREGNKMTISKKESEKQIQTPENQCAHQGQGFDLTITSTR